MKEQLATAQKQNKQTKKNRKYYTHLQFPHPNPNKNEPPPNVPIPQSFTLTIQ